MRYSALLPLLLVSLTFLPARAGEWPAWRGPLGTGISDETGVPLEWSADENITWKVPLPEPGNSTPIVWGDRVFVTGPLDNGARRTLMCFDRADGRLAWQREVHFEGTERTHATNPYCSASPVTDGQRVVVWHGSAGMFAYDFQGNELWRRDLGPFDHIWGNAASPVIEGDLVLANLGPGPQSTLLAVDKQTGQDAWRVELTDARGKDADEWKGSWSTPVLRDTADGRELLLSMPGRLAAFDLADGSERWTCRGLTDLVYTSPLVGDGVVVAMSGYLGAALATRAGGEGDVTDANRLWRIEKNPQRVGSGVILGDHVYILNEQGVAECIDVATGQRAWEERLGGTTWSSMVAAEGRLYIINMDGETIVLRATPERCEVLARNPLGELSRASLALSDGQIFARTYQHLYCIGQLNSPLKK
jgi:outer membrane protein assembly factor BamB